METTALLRSYEIFGRLLLEDRIYLSPYVTFAGICRWLDADRKALDALLRHELGISGNALLRRYRSQEAERLRQKYGTLLQKV